MQTLILVVLCALFYASFEIFAALAGDKVDGWLAAVLYNGIGTVIPLAVYLSSHVKGKTTAKGVVFASLAGIGIMLFSVLLARLFNRGGSLSFVIPTVYGLAIVLSAVFGWLALKDRITALQLVGLILISAGVICVITAKVRNI